MAPFFLSYVDQHLAIALLPTRSSFRFCGWYGFAGVLRRLQLRRAELHMYSPVYAISGFQAGVVLVGSIWRSLALYFVCLGGLRGDVLLDGV
jgi:hypothetical protein